MRVRTQRELIKTVTERWQEAYYNRKTCLWYGYDPLIETEKDKKEILYNQLSVLDLSNAKAKEINSIIGNDSWTSFLCDSCKNFVPDVVEFNEDEDKVNCCFKCIESMYDLVIEEKL